MSEFMSHTLLVWRGLVQRPFYAIATIIMFSLAIGANMAAFGIFYGYQLKPLPYTNANRLVLVTQTDPKEGLNLPFAAPETYLLLTQQLKSIQSAGLMQSNGTEPVDIDNVLHGGSIANITPSLLTTLGVHPVLGRLLSPASGTANGPHEVMISAQFWKRVFSGRADAIGKTATINGKNYKIVGVFPSSFGFMGMSDVYISTPLLRNSITLNIPNYFMVIKLKPGISRAELNQELKNMTIQINDHEVESQYSKFESYKISSQNLRHVLLENTGIEKMPKLLQVVALLALVLAIANAGNLALVRTQTNMQNFALRRMLGASLWSIIGLFLAENLPLWALSFIGACVMSTMILYDLSGWELFYNPPLNIDTGWPIYMSGFILISLAYLLVMLVPIWQILGQKLNGALGGTAKTTMSATAKRTQTGFGALQIALATILLVGSFSFSFSLFQKLHQPHGFTTTNRIVANLLLPPDSRNIATLQRIIDNIKQKPISIDAAGSVIGAYPFSEQDAKAYVYANNDPSRGKVSYWLPVVGDYFSTLGIQIKSGQGFNQAVKGGQAQDIAILSPSLAHALLGQTNALGTEVSDNVNDLKVIGISKPVSENPLQNGVNTYEIFVPASTLTTFFEHNPFTGASVIVHVRGSIGNAMTLIKHTITQTVPGAVVQSIESYQQIMSKNVQLQSVIGLVIAAFALLALILATVGVYAVNSLIVQRRQSELGIRAMLGASPRVLVRTVMYDVGKMLGIGLSAGIVIGYIFVNGLSSLMEQSHNVIIPDMLLVVVIITIVVVVTAWRPAFRAITRPVKDLLES